MLAHALIAGPIGTSDFGVNTEIEEFTGLGMPLFNPSPLILNGATYSVDSGTIRYYDFTPINSFGQAVSTALETDAMNVVFNEAVKKAGLWLGRGRGEVKFFDENEQILGSIGGNYSDTPQFIGWEAETGLIKKIRIEDFVYDSHSLVIDRVMTESVPEPSTYLLIFLGSLSLYFSKFKTKKK